MPGTIKVISNYSVPNVQHFRNEPTLGQGGWVRITDQPWDTIGAATGTEWRDFSANGSASIITDATAPISPSNVFQSNYQADMTDAESSRSVQSYFGIADTINQLYISFAIKFSSNYVGHPVTGVNKIFNILGNHYILIFLGGSADPLRATPCMQGNSSNGTSNNGDAPNANLSTNAAMEINRNEWHEVEMLITRSGNSDLWLDGVHGYSLSGIVWGAAGSGQVFGEFKYDPVWGGQGANPVGFYTGGSDMYHWCDNIRIDGTTVA